MHPLTCYAGQISLCHAKIEKISKKNFFVMIDKDGRGTIFGFYGGTAVMRGDIELMGVPPTRENPGTSYVITQTDSNCTKFKNSLHKHT